MPSKDTKTLEFNQYKKSDKAPFVIYADLECLIEKTDGRKNILENSFTTKVGKHIPSGFSVSTICSFKGIENKLDVCRGEDCMKKFWECLIDHTMKVINFKKGKMKLSTKEQQKSYENVKICYICKRNFEDKYLNNKKYREFRNRCYYTGEYRGAAHSVCNLKYSVPKEIPISFSNGSNYDYNFIIKKLTGEI